MQRLLIVGPPGAGKGTQGKRIAAELRIPAISTGDIFRSNIAERTELGVQVEEIIQSGQYVSDELTNALVRDRLSQDDAQDGFLLDGYPRTMAQVEALDAMLAEKGTALDAVLELAVDSDELVRRLLARAEVEGRADDTEEVIRERMKVYEEQTAPLVGHYEKSGKLLKVDGLGGLDEVSARLSDVLASRFATK